jgi:CheY-like chemotaxis protein
VAGETILVVDDDEIYSYALSRFLQSRGYATMVVDGSMAAFRAIEAQSVDLVITDMQLHRGEPHGASLGRVIRNKRRDLPVILVTSFPQIAEEEGPLPGPLFDKATPMHELEQAVKAVLAAK